MLIFSYPKKWRSFILHNKIKKYDQKKENNKKNVQSENENHLHMALFSSWLIVGTIILQWST